MVFSYHFDIAAILVILASLLCAWVRPNLMKTFSPSLKLLILLAILYNALDITTAVLIKVANPTTWLITYILLEMYFIVLMMFPFRTTVYLYEICGEKLNSVVLRICLIIMLVLCTAGNILFKLFFNLDRKTMVYSHGTAFYVTFIYMAICAYYVFDCVIRHKRYLGKIRVRLLITILFITIGNIFFQLIFPTESITGLVLALSVAMIIVVFCFIDITVDELTGLHNRVGFARACDELMHQQDMTGYSMIKIQIYHLQELNERTGMENGDRVIMKLASDVKYCTDIAKHKSVCGRIGGDTFAILTDSEVSINAISNANTTDLVQNPLTGLDYTISFYSGIYRLQEGDTDVDSMLDHAGYALKWVSGNFTTNVAFYDDEIRRDDEHRKSIEQRVRTAITEKEFKVYLQPVYDTMTRERVSAEALVRWIDSKNQMINPGDFIPILERNGFITELDMYVLDEVCRLIREWSDQGMKVVPVSVNFSRADVDQPRIVENIIETVDKYGLDHKLIKIELTESAFNDNMQKIIEFLQRLHDEGFIIMMDDFGSGYSNLNMFKDMPVDIVKIDMYFLKNIENSEKGMIVLESVVHMAKRLGLTIVVEGVETQQQYDYIRKIRCDMIQGYYFAKPMPSEIFPDQVTAG